MDSVPFEIYSGCGIEMCSPGPTPYTGSDGWCMEEHYLQARLARAILHSPDGVLRNRERTLSLAVRDRGSMCCGKDPWKLSMLAAENAGVEE